MMMAHYPLLSILLALVYANRLWVASMTDSTSAGWSGWRISSSLELLSKAVGPWSVGPFRVPNRKGNVGGVMDILSTIAPIIPIIPIIHSSMICVSFTNFLSESKALTTGPEGKEFQAKAWKEIMGLLEKQASQVRDIIIFSS